MEVQKTNKRKTCKAKEKLFGNYISVNSQGLTACRFKHFQAKLLPKAGNRGMGLITCHYTRMWL